MQRRKFIASSLASSAVALSGKAGAEQGGSKAREYYLLRRYELQNGPQTKLTESYFGEALIPALKRLGMGPVGAFRLMYGPETPAFYLLIPGSNVGALATVDLSLGKDAEFLKAAEAFWSAPAVAPAFNRVESWLMAAFEGWPRVTAPAGAAAKRKRFFQLRTYESPSETDHVRKVEMFNAGEFEIFKTAGFEPVFFGDTLVGSRMPNLTYMLSFDKLEELDGMWEKFQGDPAWKKLSSMPRYSAEPIVSKISNLVLSPLAASEI